MEVVALILVLIALGVIGWAGVTVYRVQLDKTRRKREIAQAYQEVAEAVKDHPNEFVREYWRIKAELRKKDLPQEK